MTTYTNWHKSTYSGDGENCVEQGIDTTAEAVGVRDTKQHGAGPVLTFSGSNWGAFLGSIKSSDDLTGGLTA
ncbi:hypothetical protein QFZ75_007997 [Streptomyces sp. V3I8]|uniref:DUF397 domain-containing protein n=1 Tax=Streptomyces sp. V3I8 TaxID=3042279 RepID=UPI00277F1FB5|nr:DUF397 domain-containing protein [Streptomyces sp. V3I8]MDQ1041495.1 hypothetical protein [Streptomyces sp. V3I8]